MFVFDVVVAIAKISSFSDRIVSLSFERDLLTVFYVRPVQRS